MVEQVRCALGHPAYAARGTKPPAFTAESDEMLVSTSFALGADETVFEPATAQVRFEFLAYEPWQARPLLGHRFEERLNVLLDPLVEHRVLGAMAGIVALGIRNAARARRRCPLGLRVHPTHCSPTAWPAAWGTDANR